MYSERVRQLIAELPNRGSLDVATHQGVAENPICGDRIEFDVRVENGAVRDCRFRADGCPGAVASAAAATLLVGGRRIEQALTLESADILNEIGGLPPHKVHGAQLAIQALRKALRT